jgi:DNA mismatch repair ATPase MutS
LKGVFEEFQTFFDRLKFQAGFYYSAILLKEQMKRFGMGWCFPTVCGRKDLQFNELKEFVMALEQRVNVVGNTCSLTNKDLLIVTGANQGGKSTFLRSIGIAQVMMQCGLMVTAESFSSGIFPKIFVHFTRREDSEMNSGRLDEELKRMSGIIDRIGDGSLVLLNESFATTTEKEGSVIAYDIIRALRESGVKILTVTHLLSFARRMHDETQGRPESGVQFLSAERKEDGRRTFRMIPHAPELTSFGLDLYEEIVGPVNDKK